MLDDLDLRPWSAGSSAMKAAGYVLGKGVYPIEVAFAEAQAPLSTKAVRAMWKGRHAGKPSSSPLDRHRPRRSYGQHSTVRPCR